MSATRIQRRHARRGLRQAIKVDTRRIARALVETEDADPRLARARARRMLEASHAVAFLVFQMGQLC